MKYIVAIVALLAMGCTTDDSRTAEVNCYSAGTKIYSGTALGRVQLFEDGECRFRDVSGKRHRITAECVVVYNE